MRKTIAILVVLTVFIFSFLFWFESKFSMDKIESQEYNELTLSSKVLIASQGSGYKNGIVNGVVEGLLKKPVYLKVIDVSGLDSIQPDDWDAIVILHTWEIFNPEQNSFDFLSQSYDEAKMYVIATSGVGVYHIEGVDGVTGASDLTQVPDQVAAILQWLEEFY